jgi:serine/threonine protein kinase
MENKSCQTENIFSSRFLSDYEPVKRLGRGGFGIVLQARDKLVDIHYAVKRIPLPILEKSRAKVMREVKSHARLNHQHIVRYYVTWTEAPPPGWQAEADAMIAKKTGSSITDPGWTDTYSSYLTMKGLSEVESSEDIMNEESIGGFQLETSAIIGLEKTTLRQEKLVCNREMPKEFLYIAMELCVGTLRDWLDLNDFRKSEVVTKLFRQVCQGVEYLHQQALIHRDLKPDNIYLSQTGCIKIGDFGLARHTGESCNGLQNPNLNDKLSHHKGTKLYMAPEMEQSGFTYTNKVDIYSLGLILVELLRQFTTDTERCIVLTAVKQTQGRTRGLDKKWGDLLSRMLQNMPDLRPDASNVLRMSPRTPKKASR